MVLSFAACAKKDTVTPNEPLAITTAAADPTPRLLKPRQATPPVVTAMNHADYVGRRQ